MSSYRNALHRREHRERSQLLFRQGLGILEKHKDYKQRAINYNKKQDTLNKLKLKASLRNPDEFYHGMINNHINSNGTHIIKNKLINTTNKQLKSMKTQDYNYLQMKSQHDYNKINKLKQNLHCLDNNNTANNHVIFVDNKSTAKQFNPTQYFQTDQHLINRQYNRPKTQQLTNNNIIINSNKQSKNNNDDNNKNNSTINENISSISNIQSSLTSNYRELVDRIDRKRKIDELSSDINIERQLMNKGARTKIIKKDEYGEIDKTKTQFKWKQERKK